MKNWASATSNSVTRIYEPVIRPDSGLLLPELLGGALIRGSSARYARYATTGVVHFRKTAPLACENGGMTSPAVPPKPCIERSCMNLALNGKDRCHYHHQGWERERNRRPSRMAYRDPAYKASPKLGICWICGRPGADTRDHVRPISKGGTNDPSNLRPAHRSCNSARGNR